MSQETLGMVAVGIPAMIGPLYMLFGEFDNKMGGAGTGFRIVLACLMLLFHHCTPFSMGNAGKVHKHWRTLNRKLNDAENLARAAKVFDGDFNSFKEWFSATKSAQNF